MRMTTTTLDAAAVAPLTTKPLELWGGVEPTVNRVGDRFFDQMARNGHAGPRGEADLERFADLGLRALRYPVLWERFAPEERTVRDWSWADRRLWRLLELGVRPIVGLVHHGSGPRRTHLLDPGFAEGLADYAGQVAARFPWVAEWTPVNEPLTTARFAALYGHWYPHARDDRSCVAALLIQCRAVILAMRAIRAVNPAARLVQTEDLGRTHSTGPLAEQAAFENARRWLTWDLLEGRVDREHALWDFLRGPGGAAEADLWWFVENATPPDVLGVNHYVTSERFLDHDWEHYPGWAHSGDARGRRYADVAAVRVLTGGAAGPGRLLREAWARYGRPLAVTEAHVACSREEQMRWVLEIWRDAVALREREGADIRAVTLWSLLGTYDWCHLLTREAGDYEPGVFDLRVAPGEQPRATGLARLARELAETGDSVHPALDGIPGWWRRPTRFDHDAVTACQELGPVVRPAEEAAAGMGAGRPLLFVVAGEGDGAALATDFWEACRVRAIPCRCVVGDEAEGGALDGEEATPWVVVRLTGAGASWGNRQRDGLGERKFTHGLPTGHQHYVWACLDELFDGCYTDKEEPALRSPKGACHTSLGHRPRSERKRPSPEGARQSVAMG